jgi:hypothetical protein
MCCNPGSLITMFMNIVLLTSFSNLPYKGLYVWGINDVSCIVLMSEFSVSNCKQLGCFTTVQGTK